MTESELQYSGDASREFWRRVKRLKPAAHREAYALGCILQYIEHHTLAALQEGERELARSKKKKRASR